MSQQNSFEMQFLEDQQRVSEQLQRYSQQIQNIQEIYSNQQLRASIKRRIVLAGQQQLSDVEGYQRIETLVEEEIQHNLTYNNATSDEERQVILSAIKTEITHILQDHIELYNPEIQKAIERSTMFLIQKFVTLLAQLGSFVMIGYCVLKLAKQIAIYFSKKQLTGIIVTVVVVGGVALIYYKINPISAVLNYFLS